jgi:hypothetical protein
MRLNNIGRAEPMDIDRDTQENGFVRITRRKSPELKSGWRPQALRVTTLHVPPPVLNADRQAPVPLPCGVEDGFRLLFEAPTHDSRDNRGEPALKPQWRNRSRLTSVVTAREQAALMLHPHPAHPAATSTNQYSDLRGALATNCFVLALLAFEIGAAIHASPTHRLLPATALAGAAAWLGAPFIRLAAALFIAASLIVAGMEWRQGQPPTMLHPQEMRGQ